MDITTDPILADSFLDCDAESIDSATEERLLEEEPQAPACTKPNVNQKQGKTERLSTSPLQNLYAEVKEPRIQRKWKPGKGSEQRKHKTKTDPTKKIDKNRKTEWKSEKKRSKKRVASGPSKILRKCINEKANQHHKPLTDDYIATLEIPKSRKKRLRKKLRLQEQNKAVHANNLQLVKDLNRKYHRIEVEKKHAKTES